MKIASVKFSSVRGASLYPAFICSHRTICIRVCPVDLVAEQVFVLLVCPGFPPHTLFFRFDQNFFLQIVSLFPHTGTPQKWYRQFLQTLILLLNGSRSLMELFIENFFFQWSSHFSSFEPSNKYFFLGLQQKPNLPPQPSRSLEDT